MMGRVLNPTALIEWIDVSYDWMAKIRGLRSILEAR
ncbi:hypothetical protein Tco_1397952, partial [Tanacetum coccineum]